MVDSSSDDDMDITGDFTAQNHPSSVQLSNGLGDLWNETNYTPPKVTANNGHSSDEDDDQTLELGPIGHLQGDASVFNNTTTKTLSQDTTVSHFKGLLHPIAEGEEATSTRSSLLSHLSLSSDEDDDDAKYVAQRESVVINLGEKFDKLGGSSGKKNKLKHDPMSLSPRHLEDQPRPTISSTVSTTTSVSLENASRTPVPTPNPPHGDKSTAFIPSDSSHVVDDDISPDPSAQVVVLAPSSPQQSAPHQPTTEQLSTKVTPLDFDTPAAQQDAPRLALHPPTITTATFADLVAALTLTSVDDAIERQVAECADLLAVSAVLPQTTTRWSQAVDQLSTWVAEMAVERRLNEAKLVPSYLAALLQTTNEFPHDLVVELYHANVSSVLSEWFAWRRRLEAASMAVWNGGAGLQAEYQGLQQRLASVGRDEAQERAAVHQLMAKARSMDRSLASIQEQQTIRAEVSARLHRLDKQLSQLQSTLAKHTQDAALHRIETTDAVVSDTHMHDRIHAVQAHDELFQIASKLAKWTYTSMSPTQWELRMMLTSLHSDMSIIVSLDVDVSKATCQVQVVLPPRKQNKQHSVFDDVAALVCAALLDPVRLQQAGDATVRQVSDVPAFVQWVQLDVQRSVRLWRDMETLVLQHAITTDVASKQLWIAFVSFQSLVKVRVGLPLSTHFCFRRWTAPPVVVVEFGKAKVRVEDDLARFDHVVECMHGWLIVGVAAVDIQ
ncbi:hypothetical protein B5M09_005540 [Aphanomyces astaci]|uniref:Spc7 kinetochore protein domain-containing protein n=1 Tax=Aphanomyces astaci TaxID=112090 RepID=A0A425D091_APHAT|nr:hypothetical protein B5M09_005540 [Aphanomyces astaci]